MAIQKERNRRFEKKSKKGKCVICGVVILVLWLILLLVGYFKVDKEKHTVLHTVYLVCIIYFLLINTVTFLLNCVDKTLAKCECEQRRVPEKVLHFFTFLGGAPATALAMLIINHKSSKVSYHNAFLKIIVAHFCMFFVCAVFLLAFTVKAM